METSDKEHVQLVLELIHVKVENEEPLLTKRKSYNTPELDIPSTFPSRWLNADRLLTHNVKILWFKRTGNTKFQYRPSGSKKPEYCNYAKVCTQV